MPGIITKEKIKILKEADNYFVNALRERNLYHKIWQAYAALLSFGAAKKINVYLPFSFSILFVSFKPSPSQKNFNDS